MLDTRQKFSLTDSGYPSPDRQGRIEKALISWAEYFVERCDAMTSWLAERPLRTFVVWALWLSCLYFVLGPMSYVKVPDCGNGTLPARMISANELLHGELGNWMSFSGCGTDRVINNFRLEPICVLLALLPAWLGYGLIMAIQRFVAGYFLFRVMRDDLRVDIRCALLSGWAFSLFHQVGIHWQWDGFTLYDGLGIPGLPLLLWLTNRFTEQRSWRAAIYSLVMGAMLGLSAPYFQTLFFPFLAVFWYTFVQPAWSWKRLGLLTCVFVGWAIITSPEMYSAAKYVPLSHRSEIIVRSDSPYVMFIENVQHWPAAVLRSNKLILIMAGIGLLFSRLRDRRVVATAIAIAAILCFVCNYHFFNDNVLSKLGVLSSFHFHRFIYLVPFLCALVMGLGLNALPADTVVTATNRFTNLRILVPQLTMVATSIFLLTVSFNTNEQRFRQLWRGENFRTLYQNPDLLALAKRQETEPDFRVACISDMWRPGLGMEDSHRWTISPGVAWAYGLETTDGYQVLYSLRYKQFWSEVLLPMMMRNQLRAYQHVYWGNMLFLWHPSQEPLNRPLVDYYNLDLLSLANTKYFISPVPLDDPDFELLPSDRRDEFIKWEKRKNNERIAGALRGEWSHRPLYIYENKRCLPRQFLVRNVRFYEEEHSLVYSMRFQSADSFRTTIHINQNDVPHGVDLEYLKRATIEPDESAFFDIGEVVVESRTSDRIEYSIDAEEACMLFVSNSYNPSWKAELDGEPCPIVPANHAFQGVVVPTPGKHRVVLKYEPAYAISSHTHK